ncbi:MAG: CoA-binding protein [Candidatus Nezhaarchaeales archaeon]
MDWNSLFAPKSIAVIGASSDPDNFTNQYVKALIEHGFKGDIFPVNPKEAEVLKRTLAYSTSPRR